MKSLTAHLLCERSQGTFASLCISHPKGVCLTGAGKLSDNFCCMEGASYIMPKLQCARDNACDVSAHTQQEQPPCACLALPPLRLLAQPRSAQRSSASFAAGIARLDGGLGTLHSCFLHDPWHLILTVGYVCIYLLLTFFVASLFFLGKVRCFEAVHKHLTKAILPCYASHW